MRQLRRVLYLQAGVWGTTGLALAIAPRLALESMFGQPPLVEDAWFRVLGLHALGLAMTMVLVAHRADELWWWSWGFAFVTVGVAAVALLNAALGLSPRQPAALWWVFAAVALAFSLGLLYGLFVASRENPLP